MKLDDLVSAIGGEILVRGTREDLEVGYAFAADLLSDLLALTEGEDRTTLVTGMVSPQVMRVADILGISVIVVVRGKTPPSSMIEYAQELDMPLLTTKKTMFETCGVMYANGVRPCRIRPVNTIQDCR